VRELRNVVERSVLLARGGEVRAEHVVLKQPRPPTKAPPPPKPADDLEDEERARIAKTLESVGGNQSRAAELLGISRRTLVRRLDELRFPRPRK